LKNPVLQIKKFDNFSFVGQGFSLARMRLEDKRYARLKPCPTVILLNAVLFMICRGFSAVTI